jgi:DMSO/TMAO reductase YedYZ heme-binding membrane subunit
MSHLRVVTSDPEPSGAGARIVTAGVLTAAFAYAVVRYVVLGTVPAAQLPVYVLNKAIAVASIALVAAALAIGPARRLGIGNKRWLAHRKALGIHGFVLGAVHAALTIAILSPRTYAKIHDTAGSLTFEGGLALLAGVAAFVALVGPAITSPTLVRKSMSLASWKKTQRTAIVALAIGLGHVCILGWRTWLTPEKWPGGLPPLTTFAVTIAAISLAVRAVAWAVSLAVTRPTIHSPADGHGSHARAHPLDCAGHDHLAPLHRCA